MLLAVLVTTGMPWTGQRWRFTNLWIDFKRNIFNKVLMVCHSDNSHSTRYQRPNKVLPPTLSVSQSGSTEAIVSDASHSPPKQVWALTFLL